MKNLLIFICLFFIPLNSTSTRSTPSIEVNSGIVVYQINSDWNERNSIKNLDALRGCRYVYGYLEDQPREFKEKIKSVPAVFITKGGKVIYRYQAGLSMVPTIGYREIQSVVNKHK
jgi:hypothetical protein